MTKIKTTSAYKIKSPLSLDDFAVGTNNENDFPGFSKGQTISMKLSEVRDLFLLGLDPETGGQLKFTEIEYEGELTSPASVANAIDPAYIVSQYEVLFLNVNGNKYILKEQDLTIGIAQDDLTDSDFINVIAFTKLGDGTALLKGYNATSGNWEFYAIKSTGNNVSIASNNLVIDPKEGTKLGDTGINVYKGLNATTKLHEFYNIDSDDFSITLTDNVISINNVSTSDTPKFYVNSGYDIGGDASETGSLGKPFKTIQGAITAYIGEGSAQEPEFKDSDIIIQKGAGYTYTGDFSINTGTGSIILEEGTGLISNPSGDWLCDFDALSATAIANFNLILNQNSTITLQKNGFRNKGTSINNSALTDSKNINISGSGQLYQSTNDAITIAYTIFESNYVDTDTFKNDGSFTIQVTGVKLYALTQQIYKVGGNSGLSFDKCEFISGSGTTNTNVGLKVFNQIGGSIRKSSCVVNALNNSTRTTLYSLTKNSAIPCSLNIVDETVSTNVVNLFKNENANQSSLNVKNLKTPFLTCDYIAKSPSVLWTSCVIDNCVISDGEVDFSQVDLTGSNTRSTYNIFDGNVVESLRIFGSRVLAVAGGLKKGSKFINRKTVNAGSFVVGTEYQILTVGTTNYTLIGASSNTVGINFTASGVGTGDGTAYQHTLDILI